MSTVPRLRNSSATVRCCVLAKTLATDPFRTISRVKPIEWYGTI